MSYLPASGGSEARLIEDLRRGEVVAYRYLYEVFAPRLYRVTERITRDPQLARDAVQETFAIVFRKIEQFDGRSALLTWVTRICMREALRLAESPQRDPAVAPPPSAAPRTSPEEHTAQGELYRRMERLIAELPIEKRTALLLFEVEGFSVHQIAEITGEPYGTLLSRLARTRAELRTALRAWAEDVQVSPEECSSEDLYVQKPQRSSR